MPLIKSLQKIGLSEKQAKVYLACLESGGAGVSDLARKAKIKRTTCYHLLNDLITLGLVSKSKEKKASFFIAEDPRIFESQTKDKLDIIEDILPELQAVHNVLPYRPRISFYEGWQGAKVIYEDTLKTLHAGETILSYTGFKDFFKYLPQKWGADYIKRRVDKKIRVRIIAPDAPFTQELKKNALKELREIKIIPEEKCRFTADIQIYSNKVGIISLKENFMSVLIESKEIADMQKMAFELMWKGADV